MMRPPSFARMGSMLLALGLLAVSIQARAQDTEAAAKQYRKAVNLHNTEAYDLAAGQWLKFIAEWPNDSRVGRAHHYLGVCYFKLKKFDDARKTFEMVIKTYPDLKLLEETYYFLGFTQYSLGTSGKAEMYDAAAGTFNTLGTKYSKGKYVADAIFYQGKCLYNRGKKKEAAEKYAQLVKDHSGHALAARAMIELGVTQADLRQHKESLATFDAFLKKFPGHDLAPEATMWRGEALYELKKYADAVEAFAAAAAAKGFQLADYATVRQADALSAMKKYAEAADVYASVPAKFGQSRYVGLCNLEAGKKYYAAGDFPKAEEFLGKVVAAGGKSVPEAAHWIARSLLKQKKPAEALEVVEKTLPKALPKGPFAAQLLMDQADAIYEIPQRRGESIALYAALAEKHPDDPLARQALYLAAFESLQQGDHKAALAHAEGFLARHAGDKLAVGVMHVAAESNLMLKKYAQATEHYKQLLKKAPGDRDADIWKVHLGTALYLQGKYAETVAALEPVMTGIKAAELVAEGWYWLGASQVKLKQFDAAVKSLGASLAAKPRWKLADDTHLMLAYACQQTKNLKAAKKNARKVIDEFPDSKRLDRAHFRLAECSRLDKDLKTAVAEYQLVLKSDGPLVRSALYGLGWAQVGLKDYAGAEKSFGTLIEKYADDKLIPRARYGRGMARHQLKKYGPAAEDLQAFLAADPASAEKSWARYILGLCQKGLKKFDQAVATFRKLIEEDPDYRDADDVYFDLGWALKSLGKDAEAAGTFAELAQKYPESSWVADSLYLVGDYAYKKKEYKKAVDAYFKAMNKAGKTKLGEEAAYNLGMTYYAMGETTKSQEQFAYQRATWPEGPLVSDATFMEAESFFKLKKFQEALDTYELVKNPSSKDVAVMTLVHGCQAAAGAQKWEKSLELAALCAEKYADSPHAGEALYQQGRAQQNLDKPTEALETYRKVVEKTDAEPAAKALFMIGEIQFGQKKYNDAILTFIDVASNYGYPKWQAYATYETGRCFEVLKKIPQALRQYQKLVEKFSESDKVPDAKNRIKALGG